MLDTERSSARIVRIEQPMRHFCLLRASNGGYLGTVDGTTFAVHEQADDAVVWERASGPHGFRHVLTGATAEADSDTDASAFYLRHNARLVALDGDARFRCDHGPADLPSRYLRTFRESGWVCLPSILDDRTVEALERVACVGRWANQDFDERVLVLNRDAVVARASVEPVSLWLARQYMHTSDIRFAHIPSIRVQQRDDGECDVQGWHADYPYLWGSPQWVGGDRVAPGLGGELALGVQRNICISAFTQTNGATCFKLGSHRRNSGPARDWGVDADYTESGFRKRNGLPYEGPDTDVIVAPAGSIILYDARTWHRAGVNRTSQKRAAMLQAVTPMYVMPFKDTSKEYKAFVHSDVAPELTERERRELASLLVHKIVGPLGHHAITVDEACDPGVSVR